jgi:hypothetical protein
LWFRDHAETGRKRENLHLPPRDAEYLAGVAGRDRVPGQAGQCRARQGSTPAGDEMLVDLAGDDDAAVRLWIR